jgi:hypothetical protein
MIEIKNVKYIRGKYYGIARFNSAKRITIQIAQNLNPTVAAYSSTLLHELLHVWVAIVKMSGGTIDRRKEHRFIYKVEDKITKLLKIMKGPNEKRKKAKKS